MKWSKIYVPTLRDVPGNAEAVSHGLLVQAGFIRQLHAGHYSMLYLGYKVQKKVERIIREEIDAIGGQEMIMPTMHPGEIWKKSGRWDTMGEIMFRLTDRRGNDNVLGVTHEEIISTVATELTSYKQLPQLWYHIQLKFRDEARPKSGLLRVREFHMKDSYSFDIDDAGLDKQFDAHHGAYLKIFNRLGLDAFGVQASNGAMGGKDSIEFMVECPAGEDDVVKCPSCDYAANVEKAVSKISEVASSGEAELAEFPTPGIRTIAALADAGHAADQQLKTLVMVADEKPILAVVRGDHQLSLQKLSDNIGGPTELRPATPEEAKEILGASPGSLGAVGVKGVAIYIDNELKGRTNMTTGANQDDVHYSGVSLERDVAVTEWLDIREAQAGEACVNCGSSLEILKCVEAGHIFKLGTTYSEKIGIQVATKDGDTVPVVMGSYGIGVERNIATVVESNHDDNGIIWPMSVAPFEVSIVPVKDDEATMQAAEKLYEQLLAADVDVVLDDRDARAGVKFADTELVGIPLRLTLGPKVLADGEVELTMRSTGENSRLPLDSAADQVSAMVQAAKAY